MSEVSERIKKLLSDSGRRQSDVVAGTTIKAASMSKYVSGTTTPKADQLLEIAEFFDVDIRWLITGQGSGKSGDQSVVEEDPVLYAGRAKGKKLRWLPVLPWNSTQEGMDFLKDRLADLAVGKIPVMTEDPDALVFLIGDEAMSPDYKPGGMAVLSPMLALESGSMVMGRISGNGVVFRKITWIAKDRFRLIATNPAFGEPLEFAPDDFDWLYRVSFVIYEFS